MNGINPEVLALRNLIKEHENRPKKKTRNTAPTNALTDRIISFIKDQGGHAMRINVSGYYRPDLKKWITSGSTLGVPDVHAIRPGGQFLGVEVKAAGEPQSPEQKKQERLIIRAGGLYWKVRSWQEFIERWEI